mgnify:FL=1
MKYTTQQVQAGIKFLNNANVHYEKDDDRINISIDVGGDRIWTSGDSIWNKGIKKAVKVGYISLNVDKYEDDREELGYYWSGGLAGTIAYDGSGKDGTWYDGTDDENNVLINKIKNEQDSDGMIYTDSGFIANSIKWMVDNCDFDAKLLEDLLDFDYSEQGMQDDGAVNLDVTLDGDFWMHCNDEVVKFTATKVA